jgi:alkylation response protein AidB-like acyl-CoA dehydrogenase
MRETGMTAEEQALIERAEALGHGLLAQHATDVDRGARQVRENLSALAATGLSGIDVPRAYGGAEVGRTTELRIVEALAYGDGTTPFVIIQHFGTSRMLAASPNEALRRAALPRMATGELLTGFGVSHLRREGRPVLAATPHGDGYRFDGAIPWITGHGIFDSIVIAGTLPDEQVVLAWVSLRESEHLRLSAPMELVAMNAARTVSARVDSLVVTSEDVLDVRPNHLRGRPNDVAVPCLFGLVRACIDDLAALAARRNAAASARAADRLAERLNAQRSGFYAVTAVERGAEDVAEVARARAAATRLSLDAAGALIVASGGGANLLSSAAQRRLREASIFATWGLNAHAIDVAVITLAGA